ncbi:hypothetical protein GUJ93_ZPchr0006g43964 [Zizania palustris]|uniref:Uncharacterized protein n=1 Tax=Zizania palustris TaxID=103762 RepID=A0A8J5SXW9_ZIZPA|nr:hypothetical protein GUJ93_ZPchr0006g43964 [Zizania palustris]
MGFFTKSTSKQTAKLKSLIKLAAARLAVVRRPRLGRLSIARGDVAQLLAIGHLDRALLRVEQVLDEGNVLEVLDLVEHYCKTLIEQAEQLDKPRECSEEIKEAAAGLMFASARFGELPELLDARAILADKFGRDFAAAAKEGAHGVVNSTLVQKLSGERASTEQKRSLAKMIATENDILLEFPGNPGEINQGKQNEQSKHVRAEQFVKQSEAKTKMDHYEVGGRQRFVDEEGNPRLARTRVQEQYVDAKMAAEAAFESASFAAMAARAAVELSRSESQGKGSRGGGYDKVHRAQNSAASEKEKVVPPSWKPHKSPSLSPSWSDRSTATSVTSVGSEGAQRGKGIVFDHSDEEEDDGAVEDVAWTPQLRLPPYRTTVSTTGVGEDGSAWHGEGGRIGGDQRPFQDGVYGSNLQHPRPPNRRLASELGRGSAPQEPVVPQRGQYRDPPYRREPAVPAAYRDSNGGATRQPQHRDSVGADAYGSSAYARPPYARIVSALERSNGHIARHEEVRRIGTDARVLQERVYGGAPLNPERRANSVRTTR